MPPNLGVVTCSDSDIVWEELTGSDWPVGRYLTVRFGAGASKVGCLAERQPQINTADHM